MKEPPDPKHQIKSEISTDWFWGGKDSELQSKTISSWTTWWAAEVMAMEGLWEVTQRHRLRKEIEVGGHKG